MLVRIATSVFVSCILSTILSSDCSADFTEERAVSLEWLTDSSQAIVVVEPVTGGEFNHGWPMRVVRILKADKRIAVGQVYTIDERVNRHAPKPRLIVFFRADQNGKLRVHETCGRDMLRYYPDSNGVTLLGFDRDGHFVESIDHAISIILPRVKRGPNNPQPNYARVENLRGPIKGGFYRHAEDDFTDFYYMVLVPADPDFRPMLELQTGLPIGYIPPGTLDQNYGSKRGPITKRPLDGESAVSTLAAVFRNVRADGSARGGLIHSRRGLEVDYNRPEEKYRQSYELSPCGKLLLARKSNSGLGTALVNLQSGQNVFSGLIYKFSHTGRYFLTGHSNSSYGIRRSDDLSLVCKYASEFLKQPIHYAPVRFTPDDSRVFFVVFGRDACDLAVFDLATGRQLASRRIDEPFFRIKSVYNGSAYLLRQQGGTPMPQLVNWRTGEVAYKFSHDCQLLQVCPNDKTVAYVKTEAIKSNDDKALKVTLFIESLATRRVIKSIELPAEPTKLCFISDGEVLMTTFDVKTLDNRRRVGLIYGVNSNEVDGETVSWTP